MKSLISTLTRPDALIALWLTWSLLALAWLAYRDAGIGTICIAAR